MLPANLSEKSNSIFVFFFFFLNIVLEYWLGMQLNLIVDEIVVHCRRSLCFPRHFYLSVRPSFSSVRLIFVSVILSAVFVRVTSQIDLHQSSRSSCRSRRHKSSQISLSAILTACKEDQFECAPGYCVPLSRRCDGYTDCVGGRDEQNCYNMSTNYHYLLQSAAKRHTLARNM